MLKRIVLIAAAACGALMTAESTARAADEPKPPLSVSIAVPLDHGTRSIMFNRPESHFSVVLRNTSDKPVNLWKEWCSWGYFNLSFEVTDDEGVTWIVKKRDRGWRKNFPDFVTLEPGDMFVIEVNFDPQVWDNPPWPNSGKSQSYTMRAIYESGQSTEATQDSVWVGKITSEAKKFKIWR